MKTISKAFNITSKDKFNMAAAVAIKNIGGEILTVTGAAIGEDVSRETGEVAQIGLLKSDSGQLYSTISATAISAIEALIECFEDNDGEISPNEFAVRVDIRNAKGSNREYIMLTMV